MENKLLLITGQDIPFDECKLIIHQPSIKEISLIADDKNFFNILDILNVSKQELKIKDKNSLQSISDFNIFMTMMQNENMQEKSQLLKNLLYMIFPQIKSIAFTPNSILLIDEQEEIHMIDEQSFNSFKDIINEMFVISKFKNEQLEYNPGNSAAEKIAEKLKRGRARVAAQKEADGKRLDILGRYVSILSVGLKLDFNIVLGYTLYQLFYLFDRYEKKEAYDNFSRLRLAGATGMKEVEYWTQ